MQEILERLPEPMQIDASVLYIAVIFLVLIVVLNKLVFIPLINVLEDRDKRIEEGSEARKKSLKTVEDSQAAYRRAMFEARQKAQESRQKLLKESEAARDQIVTETREKARAERRQAAEELEKAVEQAQTSLQRETEDIANRIVAAILSKNAA